jgi:aspartyl-tRNA(Asn)/glutamyl-tRNA(Gln) amidotransferase subunit A
MLWQLTIQEAIDRLGRREVSAGELVEACLARMDEVEERIGAVLSVDREGAREQARAADRALAAGTTQPDRPLLGVPIGLKDIIAVRGQPLTCGSKILEGFVSPYDAAVATRLKDAGAILLGRLNLDEFAMGGSTENSAFQLTHNPWDPTRTPGGSSGGSAAAVAAQECLGALGSDTGGSVRQPAAFCGVTGLKPTYGRVSRYGLVAFASSLDQIGPLTKTARDAALLLRAIAGHDARDATSVPEPVPDYVAGLDAEIRGLRLGLPREYYVGGLDPEVKRAVESAIAELGRLGAEIEEVSLPHTEQAIATYYIIATAEASSNLARFDGVRYGRRTDGADPIELTSRTRGAGFGSEVKRRIILGTYVLSSGYYDAYYLRAQKVRSLIRRDFTRAFERVDALVTPTTPRPAFRLGEKTEDPLQMYLEDIYTLSCNLAGNCGMSVPCGFTAGPPRLPIGLQLLGRPFAEGTLLRLGHAYQRATAWHREKPQLQPVVEPR